MADKKDVRIALPSIATYGNAIWGLPKAAIYIRWNEVCKDKAAAEWHEKKPVKSTTNYCEGEDGIKREVLD